MPARRARALPHPQPAPGRSNAQIARATPHVPCARGQVAARRRLFRAALRAVRSWLGSRRTWVRRRPPWMLAMVAVASDRKELRMRGEFIAFLKEYGVIGLAIAVVIGGERNTPVAGRGGGVV